MAQQLREIATDYLNKNVRKHYNDIVACCQQYAMIGKFSRDAEVKECSNIEELISMLKTDGFTVSEPTKETFHRNESSGIQITVSW